MASPVLAALSPAPPSDRHPPLISPIKNINNPRRRRRRRAEESRGEGKHGRGRDEGEAKGKVKE